MVPTTPTSSHRKASKSHSYSCSSINVCAGHWRTADFVIARIQSSSPRVQSKPPCTRPMTLLTRSSNYLKLHEKCCTAFLQEQRCENLIA